MVRILLFILISFGALVNLSFTPKINGINGFVSIELTSTHLIFNNGVGNEWNHYLLVNDQIVSENEKSLFKLNKRAPIVIEAHAIENDKNYPDVGTKKMTLNYSDLTGVAQDRFELTIQVTENSGRNAGKMAEWIFLIDIAKAKKP